MPGNFISLQYKENGGRVEMNKDFPTNPVFSRDPDSSTITNE